jgi:hypothetical protein
VSSLCLATVLVQRGKAGTALPLVLQHAVLGAKHISMYIRSVINAFAARMHTIQNPIHGRQQPIHEVAGP